MFRKRSLRGKTLGPFFLTLSMPQQITKCIFWWIAKDKICFVKNRPGCPQESFHIKYDKYFTTLKAFLGHPEWGKKALVFRLV